MPGPLADRGAGAVRLAFTGIALGVRDLGLNWTEPARRFAARVTLMRDAAEDVPEMSDDALLESAEDWLLPHLTGVRTAQDWKRFDMLDALRARLSWQQMQSLMCLLLTNVTELIGCFHLL